MSDFSLTPASPERSADRSEGRWVAVEGGELWYDVEGKGDALLLIQGLGNSAWPARFYRAGFAGSRRTIALDNRGTGRSLKPPGPYSIEQHAEDAVAVLDAAGVERVDVLGHSMGGYIAQTLALRHPDRVRSLVLVGTGAGPPTHEPVPESTLSVWLANAHLAPEDYARATMYLSFAPGWTDEHPDEYESFVLARVEYPTPPEAWRAQFDSASRWVVAGSQIEDIVAPTLVVHGDADRVIAVSNGRGIASRIPSAELVVLLGVGHYAMLEYPGFDELVAGFLDRAAD